MQIIRDGDSLPANVGGTAVSIGVYDGVHLGHEALLGRLQQRAESEGLATAVVTFDRHPALVTRPANAPKLLTTLDQKLELLDAAGVEYVYLVEFTPERAQTSATDFFEEVFVRGVRARSVVVGEDFHFGRDRGGNIDLLQDMGQAHGIEVVALELVKLEVESPEPVSSTAIRRKLAGGDIRAANAMLGRRFEIRGPVIMGDQRGRTIGFPTANVPVPKHMAWPADAVYAGWYLRPDGERHMAAINIGRRPTFYEHAEQSLLEAHVIDFDGDLYGEQAHVQFERFLRSEQRFDGIDALAAQLKQDVERARQILADADLR
ncbi:MAG: bifunctional riboflavin kinase/FAD synthetase [Acidimicrobiales bacterium]